MSDSMIDAIRQVDPCPGAFSPPPIEVVRRRLHEQPAGVEQWAAGRRPSLGTFVLVASSLAAVAIGVFAIGLLRHAHRAFVPAARGTVATAIAPGACRPAVIDGVLPSWARGGFSKPRPRMPYALGESGRIVGILWGPLDAPPAANHNNKILWVSHAPIRYGGNLDLRIQAQLMAGTRRLGQPVSRTIPGGPGPSIMNLPAPGCWRLTLHWSGWSDSLDLRYTRPVAAPQTPPTPSKPSTTPPQPTTPSHAPA